MGLFTSTIENVCVKGLLYKLGGKFEFGYFGDEVRTWEWRWGQIISRKA